MLAADETTEDHDENLVPGADSDDMRGVDERKGNDDDLKEGGDQQSAHGVDEDAADAEADAAVWAAGGQGPR